VPGALGLLSYLAIARQVVVRSSTGGVDQEMVFDSDLLSAGGVATVSERSSFAGGGDGSLEIELSRLRLRRPPSQVRLRRALARRFAHLTDQMTILVDGEPVRGEPPFQLQFPTEGYQTEIVGDLEVRWSVGFADKPLSEEERGIEIFSRGRLVQAPFTFLMTGGYRGQLGLTYMSGQLHVDALSELQPELDLRREVDWSDPRLDRLLDWGRDLVRRLLREWSRARAEPRSGRPRPPAAALEQLPESRRATARRALARIAAIERVDERSLADITGVIVSVLAGDDIDSDSATTRQLGLLVRRRLGVIGELRRHIRDRSRERPELQDLIVANPWLLEPGWRILRHERSLDRVIADDLGLQPETLGRGRRRLDCFVLADTGRAVVVELKRPGIGLGVEQLAQIQEYVYSLDRHYGRMSDISQQRRVEGLLVGSELRPEHRAQYEDVRARIAVRTWAGLLQTAEEQHNEFLDLTEQRAD
jgi:hypothetical protein